MIDDKYTIKIYNLDQLSDQYDKLGGLVQVPFSKGLNGVPNIRYRGAYSTSKNFVMEDGTFNEIVDFIPYITSFTVSNSSGDCVFPRQVYSYGAVVTLAWTLLDRANSLTLSSTDSTTALDGTLSSNSTQIQITQPEILTLTATNVLGTDTAIIVIDKIGDSIFDASDLSNLTLAASIYSTTLLDSTGELIDSVNDDLETWSNQASSSYDIIAQDTRSNVDPNGFGVTFSNSDNRNYYQIEDSTDLVTGSLSAGEFSIGIRYRVDSATGEALLFCSNNAAQGIELKLTNSLADIEFNLYNGAGAVSTTLTHSPGADNDFHTVFVQGDTSNVYLFYDGSQVDVDSQVDTGESEHEESFRIGQFINASNGEWNGRITGITASDSFLDLDNRTRVQELFEQNNSFDIEGATISPDLGQLYCYTGDAVNISGDVTSYLYERENKYDLSATGASQPAEFLEWDEENHTIEFTDAGNSWFDVDPSILSDVPGLSVSFIIKNETSSTYKSLFYASLNSDANTPRIHVEVKEDAIQISGRSADGSALTTSSVGYKPSDSGYDILQVTWDFTTGDMVLYLEGAEALSDTFTSSASNYNDGDSSTITLGTSQDSNSNEFIGKLKSFYIWQEARSLAEVESDYDELCSLRAFLSNVVPVCSMSPTISSSEPVDRVTLYGADSYPEIKSTSQTSTLLPEPDITTTSEVTLDRITHYGADSYPEIKSTNQTSLVQVAQSVTTESQTSNKFRDADIWLYGDENLTIPSGSDVSDWSNYSSKELSFASGGVTTDPQSVATGVDMDNSTNSNFMISDTTEALRAATETGIFAHAVRVNLQSIVADVGSYSATFIMSSDGTGRGVFSGLYDSSTRYRFEMYDSAGASLGLVEYDFVTAPTSTFFDAVVIGDGSNMTLYIDGVSEDTSAITQESGSHDITELPIALRDGTSQYADFIMQGMFFDDKEYDSSEVTALRSLVTI